MNLVLTGLVDSFRTLKDNTVKVVFHTNEMSTEQAANLYSMTNKYVKLHLTENNITEQQIKTMSDAKVEAEELVKGKTKSQRIRNILYLHWEQKKPMDSFDDFYNIEMEKIIKRFKEFYL